MTPTPTVTASSRTSRALVRALAVPRMTHPLAHQFLRWSALSSRKAHPATASPAPSAVPWRGRSSGRVAELPPSASAEEAQHADDPLSFMRSRQR